MTYYSNKVYKLVGYRKSKTKHKMYDAILKPRYYDGKSIILPFGDKRFGNYHDKTGLNLYPQLTHGDKSRRKNFKARHKGFLRKGHYSPSYFSYFMLW
jgi:hypothetical protein